MEVSPRIKERIPKNFFLKPFFCPEHQTSQIFALCTKVNCNEPNILFCHQCAKSSSSESHYQLHKQFVSDINLFLHDCLLKLPNKVSSERCETNEIMTELKKFLNEIDSDIEMYNEHLDHEALKIQTDFQIIIEKIDALRNLILQTKEIVLGKLKEDFKFINKDLKALRKYTEEGSPLLVKRETSVSSILLRNILGLNDSDTKYKNLEKVCKDLVNEITNLTRQFDIAWIEKQDEEGGLIKTHHMNSFEMMKKLNNSMVAIRNRIYNPPKYKTYHNSSQIMNTFTHNLDLSFKQAKEFSDILLISQNQKEMLFKGKSSLTYDISSNNLGLCKSFDVSQPKALTLCSSINTSHKKGINCISMFGNDKFATGANDYIIRIWDLLTFKFIKGFKCERIPYSVLSLEDDEGCPVLVSGHAEGYLIVVTENLEIKHVFKEQDSVISSLIALKDGRTVISGSYDETIVFYDIKNCVAIKKLTEHSESINCLDVSSTYKKLASGSDDTSIQIWNISYTKNNIFNGVSLFRSIENGHTVKTIKFLSNHPNILLSNCYNIVKMWDCELGVCIKKLCKHDHYIYKICVLETKDTKKSPKLKKTASFHEANPSSIINLPLEPELIPNSHEFPSQAQTQTDIIDLLKLKDLFILTLGQDHKIKLWNVSQESRISEVNDELKEFSVEDPFGNALLLINEKDNMVHFLSTSDKETYINIWKIAE